MELLDSHDSERLKLLKKFVDEKGRAPAPGERWGRYNLGNWLQGLLIRGNATNLPETTEAVAVSAASSPAASPAPASAAEPLETCTTVLAYLLAVDLSATREQRMKTALTFARLLNQYLWGAKAEFHVVEHLKRWYSLAALKKSRELLDPETNFSISALVGPRWEDVDWSVLEFFNERLPETEKLRHFLMGRWEAAALHESVDWNKLRAVYELFRENERDGTLPYRLKNLLAGLLGKDWADQAWECVAVSRGALVAAEEFLVTHGHLPARGALSVPIPGETTAMDARDWLDWQAARYCAGALPAPDTDALGLLLGLL